MFDSEASFGFRCRCTVTQLEWYEFRWIQMENRYYRFHLFLADSHELKIGEKGEKVGIVTGVDGIGGLIRKSCHHDPPIATKILLSPPSWHLGTNPPRGESPHLVAFTDWDKFHPKMTTSAWVNLELLTSLLAVFEANERAGEEGETDKVQCSLRPT